MRIGPRLVLLVLLAICPSAASAEPVTLLFDVTVTDRARYGSGLAESIDPIFFTFGVHFDNTVTSSMFGTPTFDLVPLVADGPNLTQPLDNGWVMENRILDATTNERSVSIGGNNTIPFSRSFLRMDSVITGALTPPDMTTPRFTNLIETLMLGPLSFNYDSFRAFEIPDESGNLYTANSFSYFGTATLRSWSSVPEPSTVLLMGTGALFFLRRRRASKR